MKEPAYKAVRKTNTGLVQRSNPGMEEWMEQSRAESTTREGCDIVDRANSE